MSYDGAEDKTSYESGLSVGGINKCRHEQRMASAKAPDNEDFSVKDTYELICCKCKKVIDEEDS